MSWFRRLSEMTSPEASRPAERREATRLDKVFAVWLDGEHGRGLGVARNISEGGMFVETSVPQPIGTQVRIAFPSEAGDMTAVAEVRYVCHLVGRRADRDLHAAVQGIGVRFLYFEPGEAPRPTLH